MIQIFFARYTSQRSVSLHSILVWCSRVNVFLSDTFLLWRGLVVEGEHLLFDSAASCCWEEQTCSSITWTEDKTNNGGFYFVQRSKRTFRTQVDIWGKTNFKPWCHFEVYYNYAPWQIKACLRFNLIKMTALRWYFPRRAQFFLAADATGVSNALI